MPPSDSQTFLFELDKRHWVDFDRWWSNLDAAVCKHAVLGLNFLKYVSDSFAQRQHTFDIENEIQAKPKTLVAAPVSRILKKIAPTPLFIIRWSAV